MNTRISMIVLGIALLPMQSFGQSKSVAPFNPFTGQAETRASAPSPIVMPIPPAPSAPPPPPPEEVRQSLFAGLSVIYIGGREALLRDSTAGEARIYSVLHNVRTRIHDKWLVPEISNGVVTLYSDTTYVKGQRPGDKEFNSGLVWSGSVQARALPVNADASPQPVLVGTPLMSPSRKAIRP